MPTRRFAIVSDIHGNLTAFEAVLADLRQTAPDLIFHGGDIADAGSNPAEVVDRIRDLRWPGVMGNTDDMLANPESLEEFGRTSTGIQALLPAIREMAAATREALGKERLTWLRSLPLAQTQGPMALVHAGPGDPWRCPADESAYAALAKPVVIFGHIHRSFVKEVGGFTLVNSGSVSLSYDGDPRASYALLDDGTVTIRRVEYDVEGEISRLSLPHKEWIAKILRAAGPQMP
jgi:putative phosphoesterase